MFFVTLTLIVLASLAVLGAVFLYLAFKKAPIGYQDAAGFHYGREPEPKAPGVTA